MKQCRIKNMFGETQNKYVKEFEASVKLQISYSTYLVCHQPTQERKQSVTSKTSLKKNQKKICIHLTLCPFQKDIADL